MASIRLKTKVPGPKSSELMARRKEAVARGPFHTTPIFASRAHGALLEDVDGNQFIDFAAGIGVVNAGHTPDSIQTAVAEQAKRLVHGSFNVTAYESYVALCERLNRAAPGNFAKKSFLANSGAEAVENAIKIARAYTGKQGIVCFDHAFHGRTFMAMTLTSKAKPYRYGFGPYFSDVHRAPFPYPYRGKSAAECFAEFESLINSRVSPTQVAAVIMEPVLGEGGFLAAPPEFIQKVSRFCTDNKIVFIADEIQSGFGRTGTLFACEQLGVAPDLITSAKGLGGGMPISAVTGRAEIMDAPIEGGIGGTFGGNPLSCAAALAVFDLFEKGDLLRQSKALGEKLRARLDSWQKKFPIVGEVRGLGPMLAIELVKDRSTKEPHAEATKELIRHSYENGVITMSAGSYSNVIRFLMPLMIGDAELNEGLDILEAGLQKLK